VPVLPAPSDCAACAEYWPSANPVDGVTDQEVPDRVADNVCTNVPLPALHDACDPEHTNTDTVDESALVVPAAAAPAVPANAGVESLTVEPFAGAVIVTLGAAVSTTNLFTPDVPVLPAPSDCAACAEYWPSANPVDGVTDQEVPDRVADNVCTNVPLHALHDACDPEHTNTDTVDESALCELSAACAPADPENVGFAELPNELFT